LIDAIYKEWSSTSFSPFKKQIHLSTRQAKKQCLQCGLIARSGVFCYHFCVVNKFQSFGVVVRWPGKKAEHSFFLDFFVSFFVKKKEKND
jgi:hypothetical protein